MLILSSRAAVLSAIDAARRRVDLGAYVLGAGQLRDALAAAARRGNAVTVTLQRDPYGDPSGALRRENAASARVLRAAGVTVHAFERERRPFHLKAAVIDGTSYLDDRNWPAGGGIVVRDTRRVDADIVTRALRGAAAAHASPRDGALATTKDAALAAALRLVRAAAPTAAVVWSTESFGAGPVAAALRARAQAGEPTRLILDARRLNRAERSLVDDLARAGVAVTRSSADEKFVLAGAAVWVGSANATDGGAERGDQTDWGAVSRDPALVARVRQLANG